MGHRVAFARLCSGPSCELLFVPVRLHLAPLCLYTPRCTLVLARAATCSRKDRCTQCRHHSFDELSVSSMYAGAVKDIPSPRLLQHSQRLLLMSRRSPTSPPASPTMLRVRDSPRVHRSAVISPVHHTCAHSGDSRASGLRGRKCRGLDSECPCLMVGVGTEPAAAPTSWQSIESGPIRYRYALPEGHESLAPVAVPSMPRSLTPTPTIRSRRISSLILDAEKVEMHVIRPTYPAAHLQRCCTMANWLWWLTWELSLESWDSCLPQTFAGSDQHGTGRRWSDAMG